MKKAKENWTGEQCGETEENLRTNNSERAYQLVKDLTTCETRGSYYYPRLLRKMPHGRTGDTTPMDKIALWGVLSQDQWRSICTELSPHRHRGRPARPSQRSKGCSTINEEESQLEVTLSKQSWPKQVEKQSLLLSRRQSATQIWQTEEWPSP